MVSSVFSKQSGFPGRVTRTNVKSNTLGSKTTSKPLISKRSFWIRSDSGWFPIVFDPVILQGIRHCLLPVTLPTTRWTVTAAARRPSSSMLVSSMCMLNTRMSPLELIHLKASAWFMKNPSSNWMQSPSLTFSTSCATELVRCGNDETICVFSSPKVDHASRIGMTKLHVQSRHHGSGCFSLFFNGQVPCSVLLVSTMSIGLDGRIFCRYRQCHQVLSSARAVNRHRMTCQGICFEGSTFMICKTRVLTSCCVHCDVPFSSVR